MSAQPLVSVVVRSTDHPMLDDVLACLALQTYPRVEVIVVSTVGKYHRHLPPWCGRFPLCVIGTSSRLTRSQAANTGLDAAHGHYIAVLDGNQRIEAAHLASLVKLLETNSDVAVAHADVGGRRQTNYGIESLTANQSYYPFELIYENYLSIDAVVFRRSLIEKGCRFDENPDLDEVWDFWVQIAAHTKFMCSSELTVSDPSDPVTVAQNPSTSTQDKSRVKLYAKWLPHWQPEQVERILMAHAHQYHAVLDRMQFIEKQNAELQQEIINKYEQLQIFKSRIYQSTSWRLTAPIRWLKCKFSKV
jgi:glycosyltransferase involved in cell wall biosynthesis